MSTKDKIKEYKANPHCHSISLSSSLIICAFSELRSSLRDRSNASVRSSNNHETSHAVGSIVLLVTSFDAFLSEGMESISFVEPNVLDLASEGTSEKYKKIIKNLGGEIELNEDITLVIKLRDEIVHYLPRFTPNGNGPRKYIPRNFWSLDKRELFLIPSSQNAEIPFARQVCSYRLAYWAWQTIDAAATNFVTAFDSTKIPRSRVIYQGLSQNFKKYLIVTPPDRLSEYDAQWNLKLTG